VDTLDFKDTRGMEASYHHTVAALVLFCREPHGREELLVKYLGQQKPWVMDHLTAPAYAELIFGFLNVKIYKGIVNDNIQPVFSSLLRNFLWSTATESFYHCHMRLWEQYVDFLEQVISYLYCPQHIDLPQELEGANSRNIALYVWHLTSMGIYTKINGIVQSQVNFEAEAWDNTVDKYRNSIIMLRALAIFLRKDYVKKDSPFYTIVTLEEYAKRMKLAQTIDAVASSMERVAARIFKGERVSAFKRLLT
jgi:hypothetical protein